MNPDLKESLPREILEELMEQGAEAFRSVLEKLLNLAMELERAEFWERTRTSGQAGGATKPTGSRTRRWPRGWDD